MLARLPRIIRRQAEANHYFDSRPSTVQRIMRCTDQNNATGSTQTALRRGTF